MKMVTLKNGTVAVEPLVTLVMNSLNELYCGDARDFLAFYASCKGNHSKPFHGDLKTKLLNFGFLAEDGTLRESIRNIALSAVVEHGDSVAITWPIVEQPDPAKCATENYWSHLLRGEPETVRAKPRAR